MLIIYSIMKNLPRWLCGLNYWVTVHTACMAIKPYRSVVAVVCWFMQLISVHI